MCICQYMAYNVLDVSQCGVLISRKKSQINLTLGHQPKMSFSLQLDFNTSFKVYTVLEISIKSQGPYARYENVNANGSHTMGRKTGSYNLNLNSSYMTGKALLLVILRHLVSLSL